MNWCFEWWYKWGSVGPIALLLCSFSFRVLELVLKRVQGSDVKVALGKELTR